MAPVTYAFQNIKSTKKLRNFSKLKNFVLVAMPAREMCGKVFYSIKTLARFCYFLLAMTAFDTVAK